MEISVFTTAAQLGGTVFTVVMFLWYLSKRDDKWTDSLKNSSDSNVLLARALQRLTDRIEVNSNVNIQNTTKIDENVVAVKKNTEVISKNTEIIGSNGKH